MPGAPANRTPVRPRDPDIRTSEHPNNSGRPGDPGHPDIRTSEQSRPTGRSGHPDIRASEQLWLNQRPGYPAYQGGQEIRTSAYPHTRTISGDAVIGLTGETGTHTDPRKHSSPGDREIQSAGGSQLSWAPGEPETLGINHHLAVRVSAQPGNHTTRHPTNKGNQHHRTTGHPDNTTHWAHRRFGERENLAKKWKGGSPQKVTNFRLQR